MGSCAINYESAEEVALIRVAVDSYFGISCYDIFREVLAISP